MDPMNTNPMDEGQLNMGNPVDRSQFMGGAAGQNQPDASADADVQSSLNPSAGGLSASDPNVAACPVCGTLVDTRTARDTLASPVNQPMGTIYFDSAQCKAEYEQDPQRYGSSF